jgi:hypothetical protein
MPAKFRRVFEITARDDTYPLAVVPATWIDSLPSPMWAGRGRPSYQGIPSKECLLELLHLCHLHDPDSPLLHVNGCSADTFGTPELAEAADADLNTPLVITCLFNQEVEVTSEKQQAAPGGTSWTICHGDVAQWWALIECRLGDEAVPAWMIQLHGRLCRQMLRGALGSTTLSASQLNELSDLLCQAAKASQLNIEDDFDTSPEARLLWKWNTLLSMYAVSMDDDANENDDIDWKDCLPQEDVPRFGVFLTQSMCDWLVDQADSYESAIPMSDRTRNLIWGQKRLLRKSGGILITNQHF